MRSCHVRFPVPWFKPWEPASDWGRKGKRRGGIRREEAENAWEEPVKLNS